MKGGMVNLRGDRRLVVLIAVLVLIVPAAAYPAHLPLVQGGLASTLSPDAQMRVNGSSTAREALVSQSGEVSLAKGGGPATGHPERCREATLVVGHCQESAAPLAAATPLWYDVANDTGLIAPTYVASIAWDPTWGNGTLVYFGGCEAAGRCPDNYTWVYDGSVWSNVSSSIGTAPPPLAGQSMDWDPVWGGIVLAGGEEANGLPEGGTWLFSDGEWQNITTSVGGLAASPPTLFGAMAFDPALQGLLYLGGCTNATCGRVAEQAWTLTGLGDWSSLSAPAFFYGESMAYDVADQEMVVYGGADPLGATLNTTFAFADGGWFNLTSISVGCFLTCDLYPPGRSFASMTWDAQTDSILMFGGIDNLSADLSDSWSFSGNSWTPFTINGSSVPPASAYDAMPPDSAGFAPALVGGDCSCAGRTYTFDVPPDPVISLSARGFADAGALLSVEVTGTSGAGSGPWLYLDADFGDQQFDTQTLEGVNGSSAWSFVYGPVLYPTVGMYALSATVTDFFYVNATAHYNLTVVAALVVNVSRAPFTGEAGEPVSFNATVADGVTPYSFSWVFGDGQVSYEPTPTHIYASGGIYNGSLTVLDAGGGSAVVNFTVDIVPGLAVQASANVTAADEGIPVQFVGTATGGSPYPHYFWQFGDGTAASSAIATHVFSLFGFYKVSLTVTDQLGAQVMAELSVLVNTTPTAPTVVANPSTIPVGSPTTLSVPVLAGTPPYSYSWTFGDGTEGSGPDPVHVYSSPGAYLVRVTVTDAVGQRVATTGYVTVSSSSGQVSSLTSGFDPYLLAAAILAGVGVVVLIARTRKGRPTPSKSDENPLPPDPAPASRTSEPTPSQDAEPTSTEPSVTGSAPPGA